MIRADLHNHTCISHGANSLEEMYARARSLGLEYFGFSEHSPLPQGFFCRLYTGDLAGEFPAYCRKVRELAERPGPKALLGMELDWLPSRRQWMENLAASAPFDYVLGSLHYLDGYSVGARANWGPEAGLWERFARFDAYFCEMAAMAGSGLLQAASHPDFIKLRAWADFRAWLKEPQSRDILAFALESMAKNRIVMEVSSAGLRQDFHEPYPGPEIMSLAHDLGVGICFGSDAHRCEDIGAGFRFLADYAASFGYRESAVFVERQPLFRPFA